MIPRYAKQLTAAEPHAYTRNILTDAGTRSWDPMNTLQCRSLFGLIEKMSYISPNGTRLTIRGKLGIATQPPYATNGRNIPT
jgi:hypothetical protein